MIAFKDTVEKNKASNTLHCKYTMLLNVQYKKKLAAKLSRRKVCLLETKILPYIYRAAPSILKMPNKQDKYR